MGPHKKDRQLLEAIIAEKDAELENIRVLLETQTANYVAAKSRLELALNTLDSVQAQHASELAAEIKAKERLRDALTRYSDVAKIAELERDNLRDAVIELAEKIELSKDDLTSWSHSRIKITRNLEPLEPMGTETLGSALRSDLWAYASGVIALLRSSLASECRAHTETRKAARARIALLEAQVARLDAELQQCITHAGPSFSRASGSRHILPSEIPEIPPSPPPMPTNVTNATLHRSLAHNVLLEEEVEKLAALLEEARLEAAQVSSPPGARQTASSSTTHPPVLGPDIGSRNADRQNTRLGEPSRWRSKSGSQRRSASSAPSGPQRLSPPNEPTLDPDRTIRPDPRIARSFHTEDIHASLDREIAALGAKIEKLHTEKEIILAQVQAESSSQLDDSITPHPQTLLSELSQQRGVSANEAPPTSPLRSLSLPLPIERPPGSSPQVPAPAPLLEDYDGSMSMDLATPLLPTVLLPALAGPSTLPPPPFQFTPQPLQLPSTEISPLDLRAHYQLPGAAHNSPLSPADSSPPQQSGEEAVQELMGIVATSRRRGS
ncbi:hypothetical protein R3P38DRAFT_2831780 [Favolaschia claudopus]|uniref:Uncharacterized protein n=1 Tax=Favolaschia claudopus TaxID=2862362 RepID=A0AAW0E8T4_9AGAR